MPPGCWRTGIPIAALSAARRIAPVHSRWTWAGVAIDALILWLDLRCWKYRVLASEAVPIACVKRNNNIYMLPTVLVARSLGSKSTPEIREIIMPLTLLVVQCFAVPSDQGERYPLSDAHDLGSGSAGAVRESLPRVLGELTFCRRQNWQAVGIPRGEQKDPGTRVHTPARLRRWSRRDHERIRRKPPMFSTATTLEPRRGC